MAHFKKCLKYNFKRKIIHYRKKFNSLNILIKIAIKLDNQLYKLHI